MKTFSQKIKLQCTTNKKYTARWQLRYVAFPDNYRLYSRLSQKEPFALLTCIWRYASISRWSFWFDV